MDLDSFIRERRPRWDRFERLLDGTDAGGEHLLDPKTLQELVRLYRQTCSDLNHARSITAQPLLLDRLNKLAGRGYRFVYRDTRRLTLREALRRLFLFEIPSTFRRQRTLVGTAAAAMLLGALFGFAAVLSNPALSHDLIPQSFDTESARERVSQLEKSEERINSVEAASLFSAFLMSHNIEVSFLCFSLGAFTILGGYGILFYNGIILGAVAAQYVMDGVTTFFVAWVGPHGALELPAIVFSGAAGILAGRALLLPGNLSVASSLRKAFPDLRRMLLGTAAILVLAGLVEGSFSQFTQKSIPYGLKIGVAAALFIGLISYLFIRRGGIVEEES
ncbi:MAG TPA: stage II sporulation protein M [Planctomycetota bacterium]|nr:stage II sporulation protein M [Planctomycetota bacterium]